MYLCNLNVTHLTFSLALTTYHNLTNAYLLFRRVNDTNGIKSGTCQKPALFIKYKIPARTSKAEYRIIIFAHLVIVIQRHKRMLHVENYMIMDIGIL